MATHAPRERRTGHKFLALGSLDDALRRGWGGALAREAVVTLVSAVVASQGRGMDVLRRDVPPAVRSDRRALETPKQ
jgi:hypothetical protein